MIDNKDPRRSLPSLDAILKDSSVQDLISVYGRVAVTRHLKKAQDRTREHLADGIQVTNPTAGIIRECEDSLSSLFTPTLKRVINATGVILHTNLGRSPLSELAVAEVAAVASSFSSLELDLKTGERGHRHSHAENLLIELTGCEAASVVNNNAGATLLVLKALIGDNPDKKEVLISRGELVEIGGGFRMPDVMAQSNAVMVEVGTTNRTHLSDYQKGLTPNTAAVFRAHTSNYRIEGFTTKPSSDEISRFTKENGLIFIDDIGSGAITDLSDIAQFYEPTVIQSVADADIVLFSGDKLLGGPQSGIILGKIPLIEKIRTHPLSRALRPDKLCLAALQATLRSYLDGSYKSAIPLWRMLNTPFEELKDTAGWIKQHLEDLDFEVDVIEEQSLVGGGSLPGVTMRTACVLLRSQSPERIADRLRSHTVPIIVRRQSMGVLIDVRTLFPRDLPDIIDCFRCMKEEQIS